jgi:uncharacterized protein YjdB
MYFLNFKQMKRFFKVLANTLTIAAFAALVLVSCKKDPDPVAPVAVTKVTVAPSTLSIKVGEKSPLTVTVEPENAEDKTLTWSSSDPGIATVSAGEVTAVAVGSATITATASNGVTGTSAITVVTNIVDETGVSICVESTVIDTLDLIAGEQQTLTAIVEPENASNKTVVWSSTFPTVASVNTANGTVTAVAGGIAKIVAVTVNGLADTCVVRVTQPLTAINLDTTPLELVEGNTHQLEASPVPANATNYNPVWETSDSTVAVVTQAGLLTAIYEGTAVITLTSDTVSVSVNVTVRPELPRAKLFDFTLRPDGTAYDASPNGLEIIEGPAKPDVQLNSYYNRYEAIVYTPTSRKYPDDDPLFPGMDFSEYADMTYTHYQHMVDPTLPPNKLGSGRVMGFYKIPWHNSDAMFEAYTNAFSYEILFMVPEYYWTSNHTQGEYLFGNVNTNTSGFGIKLDTDWQNPRTGEPVAFYAHYRWGNGNAYTLKMDGNFVYGKYYHVIATYDRHNPNEVTTLYIDGVKIGSDTEHIGEYMFLATDYHYGNLNNLREKKYEPGLIIRHEHMENLWIGNIQASGGWAGDCWGPNKTHYVIARVYDKALSKTEIEALYAAVTK